MDNKRKISVSVGLPVYNGERYISSAIDSVLSQSFNNFAFVICDNNSSDGTEEICRSFAKMDNRIIYMRNSENIGCSPNYNKTFLVSPDSDYFMWLAHDDCVDKYFLERCVEGLERSPENGLCHTAVKMIDEAGKKIGVYANEMRGASSPKPHRRLRCVLVEDPYCQSVFSVYRSSVLRKTNLFGSHHNSDRVLLAEMALLAPFHYVNEALFSNRMHDRRYTSSVKADGWSSWHDPLSARTRQFPLWTSYVRYIKGVGKIVSGREQRLLCYGELIRWWFVGANAGHMLIDALSAYEPRVFTLAQKAKHRIVGSRADWLVAHGRETDL
jgi:glycosyltransferase involved in cell wall biosynthesis